MAVKNHALDQLIVDAARAEFMEKGFRGASLHKIAARAGLTTGALYTRYKNKDDLFCSLLREALEEIGRQMQALEEQYGQARLSGDLESIVEVIRREESVYRDILFRYPEDCTLFFCCSDGSSLDLQLRQMMERKEKETVAYLKSISKNPDVDLDGVGMIISTQFQCFRQVLERGYSREKALACMETVELYMRAGWKTIFQAIRGETE